MSQKSEGKGHVARWEEMFGRLVEFKKKHGHCHVPNQYKKDRRLGNWVATQRRQYKSLRYESKHLTDEKVKRLREIGFDFSPKDPDYVPWESRFNEYVMFVNKYGHIEVPYTLEGNEGLSLWVSAQRQEYKLRKKGFSSHLTGDRVDLLNKVGFIWEPDPKKSQQVNQSNHTSNTASLASNMAGQPVSGQENTAGASSNMEGVVSVLQQCINTLRAQQEMEQQQVQQQQQQVQQQQQQKAQIQTRALLSSILGNASIENNIHSAGRVGALFTNPGFNIAEASSLPAPAHLPHHMGNNEFSPPNLHLLAQVMACGNGEDEALRQRGIKREVPSLHTAATASLNSPLPTAVNLPVALNFQNLVSAPPNTSSVNILTPNTPSINHFLTANLPVNLTIMCNNAASSTSQAASASNGNEPSPIQSSSGALTQASQSSTDINCIANRIIHSHSGSINGRIQSDASQTMLQNDAHNNDRKLPSTVSSNTEISRLKRSSSAEDPRPKKRS